MYQQAVVRLIRAADQVSEYRGDLATFADTLAGKKWGSQVAGPIQDMDGQLAAVEGAYRDLAALMRHQGDQGAGAYDQAPWVPDDLLTQESYPTTGGSTVMGDRHGGAPTQGGADDVDDEDQAEEEVFTHCLECDDPLDTPVKREADACHPECDPANPPQFWMGALAPGGNKIDPEQAESYRKLKNLAEDAFDSVLEWETPYGDTFISFPDGGIIDAREWIERPENLELAGGRDQYAGRGEFDPSAPNRCWIGQTLPSGRLARPLARSYDNVAELATYVCKEVFERDRMDDRRPYTIMLPGGELVDASDWAQRPETRRLAGCTTVRNFVRFRATGTCPMCGEVRSSTNTQLIQGEIGEHQSVAAAVHCDTCNEYLPPVFVPITLVDDASAAKGAPPRLIDNADPDIGGTATS